jgi:AcrR family transcriptional regulator
MRSTRKEAEDFRAAAVREATRLFARRGAGAVSVQDVAEAVGASKQALLYHFKTKDALVDAVLRRLLEQANGRLVTLMGTLSGSGDERMAQALAHLRTILDAEPHAAAVLLRFMLDGGTEAAQRLQEGAQPWLRFMVDLIERGQREGTVRPELDAEAAVVQVGILLLTNFALMPMHTSEQGSPREWQQRRLTELVRAVRAILFVEPPPSAPKRKRSAGTARGKTVGPRKRR